MKENKTKLGVCCGTCGWYDPFIDMCQNPKKPNSRTPPVQKSECELWERERHER